MNNKSKVFVILACAMSVYGFAQQQTDSTKVEHLDEVVVTDSRFHLKRENSGKIITKITQKDLQHLQGKSVAEIINTVSGVEINGTKSNAGQNLAYYIRGGRNRQVLVLIDGIAVTDPSQIANDYDLRLLNTDQVESIEILKGASSTLYGSGAATAVINITLKKTSKDAISGNFMSVLGTNQSQNDKNYRIEGFRNSVSINGTLDKLNYLASFGNQYTDGLSAVSTGTEADVYNAINGNLKLGYVFSETFKMNAYVSFDKFKADFDDGFAFLDADNLSTTKQNRIGIAPKYSYKNGSLSLNAAYNHVEREIESDFPTLYNGKSYVADLFNRYQLNDKFYTILGVNAQQNEMENFTIPFGETDFLQDINPEDAKFTIVDPYTNVVYVSDFGLNVNAGLRFNNHSEYGSHLVYSLNPSFKKEMGFGYIKGLASYSTAYITPSLYQLFEPTYGNADLKPEENRTIEAGIEANITDKVRLSVVYFNRKETNFIDFVDAGNFVFQYKNIDQKFTASGVEVEANFEIANPLQLQMNGTYTKVEDDLNLRIPEFKANASLQYQLCDATFMSVSYQFNGKREDSVFNNTTFENDIITLKPYSLLDVYISQKLIQNKLKIFANITNLLNEEYMELFGYSTKGRNINLGITLSL